MGIIDLILGGILVYFVYKGYEKGFIETLVGYIALMVAIIGSFYFLKVTIQFLEGHMGSLSKFTPLIAFIILFLMIMSGVKYLGKMLKKIVDLVTFGVADRIFGIAFGLLKGAFIGSVLVWLLGASTTITGKDLTTASVLAPILQPIAQMTINAFSAVFPFLETLYRDVREILSTPATTLIDNILTSNSFYS